MSERRYSVKEAAALTGVDERTLRRWDAAGFVHAARTAGGDTRSGHRRFTDADLKRIVVIRILRDSERVKYKDLGAVADALERNS